MNNATSAPSGNTAPKEPVLEKQPILKPAVSLLWNHVGGLLACVVVCIGAGFAGLLQGNGLWFSLIALLFLYSLPIYNNMWTLGHNDKNLADFGHIKLKPSRGILIGLLANSPNLLLGLLFFLSKFGIGWNITVLYKFLNPEIWPLINLIQPEISMLDFTVWQALLVALLPLIPVVIAEISYYLGTRDFSIGHKLVYKDPSRKPKQNVPKP